MKNKIYRNEYPNYQFRRENYQILNGLWDFIIDNDNKYSVKQILKRQRFKKINVPFAPEAKLSLINHKDFIKHCYYKKEIELVKDNNLSFINFNAVDYEATLYVNGIEIGTHKGGYTPFKFEISKYIINGKNSFILHVTDENLTNQARGKQSYLKDSFGCFYTRTTGIWQSVWLEKVPQAYIENVKFSAIKGKKAVNIDLNTNTFGTVNFLITYKNKEMANVTTTCNKHLNINVNLLEKHLWDINKGNLYDIKISFENDVVYSYFGLRFIDIKENILYLNNKPIFQRLVLDQGYYEDGIYTAKDVTEFKKDIMLAKRFGFNGARLHQKVFESNFLYECDKQGYIVWGEYPSWCIDFKDCSYLNQFKNEWKEEIERDYSHPCIITWCPLNETWEVNDGKNNRDANFLKEAYKFTKELDKTRPCVDASGGFHCNDTDIFDIHNYQWNEDFKKHIDALNNNEITFANALSPSKYNESYKYLNQPIIISEFGGMKLKNFASGWGYNDVSLTNDEFVKTYTYLVDLMLNCNKIVGFCYTQLYDVEQEMNGLYTYKRKNKLSNEEVKAIKKANISKASVEK